MFDKITAPQAGTAITISKGTCITPNNPIIPFIEGDGSGRDIWKASKKVFDAATAEAYKNERKIVWLEVYAGEKACSVYGKDVWLPEDTLQAIKEFKVAIKGPLTTPVGEGFRSINVTLRQQLDLYACVRPVRYFSGVPSPLKTPEKLDVVIFRENTEDVYAGVEWAAGSKEANKIRDVIISCGKDIREASAIGIKPISEFGSKRLIRKAIQYAIDNNRKVVTLVHKGNIMKFTEGAFMNWGYELARKEFGDMLITENDLHAKYEGKLPKGKIVINDRIADNMFQQILLRPHEYSVIATTNLNGDYLSDACAAQVGGLGIAPGANVSDDMGMFEATHGTAPKYADQDIINPSSVLLSGALMFEFIGWQEVARLIISGLEKTIGQKYVTYDLERSMSGATRAKTSEFADRIVKNIRGN